MPVEDDNLIRNILANAKTIALVGASVKQDRDSNHIGKYLMQQGYTIVPVNPAYDEVLGVKCYPDLQAIPIPVDIVDVFRKKEAVDEIVDQALAIKAKTLWLQIGVINAEAAERAERNGLQVVMNHCIAVEHLRLIRPEFKNK